MAIPAYGRGIRDERKADGYGHEREKGTRARIPRPFRKTGGRTLSAPPFKDAARVDVLLYAQVRGVQEQKDECVLHTGLHKVCHGGFPLFFRKTDDTAYLIHQLHESRTFYLPVVG